MNFWTKKIQWSFKWCADVRRLPRRTDTFGTRRSDTSDTRCENFSSKTSNARRADTVVLIGQQSNESNNCPKLSNSLAGKNWTRVGQESWTIWFQRLLIPFNLPVFCERDLSGGLPGRAVKESPAERLNKEWPKESATRVSKRARERQSKQRVRPEQRARVIILQLKLLW